MVRQELMDYLKKEAEQGANWTLIYGVRPVTIRMAEHFREPVTHEDRMTGRSRDKWGDSEHLFIAARYYEKNFAVYTPAYEKPSYFSAEFDGGGGAKNRLQKVTL